MCSHQKCNNNITSATLSPTYLLKHTFSINYNVNNDINSPHIISKSGINKTNAEIKSKQRQDLVAELN